MSTSKEEFDKAFSILSQFERQLISPKDFSWDYITSRVEPSKPTLWRNLLFRDEFNRVKKLVRSYKDGKNNYDLDISKESVKDAEIASLRREVEDLNKQLSKERERLAYAAVVARRNNIDPILFEKESPLLRAIGRQNKSRNI
ncbi:TPA: hypothetical protein ACMDQC_004217 [Vibrio parahaemolyticus]|uniref:hypothetical protein n=1 Tax=Vibrio parahaemolyticus TaxID=670 RepID=UPI00084BB0C2|nr:hypothetical protein [Vibrio parahaemolyticus]EGR1594082.1 hypothetical protein [Vibrio parahaemolyticus]EGR1728143.1 hypothetical protein [Vibrio parahaemolyticus]ODW34278.1 hypothetical protein BBM88_03430 [Vibrio parahaemolyticus]ODY63851.1 hypothetical protein BBM27_22070 [Vibrio parahaemolyticus]ODY75609.1 hypothetical protein BBM28_04375 [Vibrio parahaemolyticus]